MTEHHHKLAINEHRHTHVHEEDEEEEIEADVAAKIFDAHSYDEIIPEEFDAVKIAIDGKVRSDLDWQKERNTALGLVIRGLRIFWEIDLGLFHALRHPLGNQTQFMSLCLSLEHFRDTLWKEFRSHTVGLCIYRGPVDFSRNFKWDEEQTSNLQGWLQDQFGDISAFKHEIGLPTDCFAEITPEMLSQNSAGRTLLSLFCRDAVGEYFDLLVNRLPDTLKGFLLFDGEGVSSPLLLSQLQTKERYPRLSLGIKNEPSTFFWEKGFLSREMKHLDTEMPRVGICLPKMLLCRPQDVEGLEEAFTLLHSKKVPFRVVSESTLTTDWDGLDYLIVVSRGIDHQAKRKLNGFCAAGGVVVVIGQPIGVAEEIPFHVDCKIILSGAF